MKKTQTIFIIAMLLASVTAISGFATAQSGDPYVRVIWETADELHEWENEAEESQWIFGPQPDLWIGYADNLTSIGENFYQAELETDLLLNITIPKSFLGEDNDLDVIRFWGSKQMDRSPIFVMEYNATADSWSYFSFRYQPGQTEPVEGNFLVLDIADCEYEAEADYYKAVFAFKFEGPLAPGIFWTGMQAVDTDGRPVTPSWLNRLTTDGFQSPPIAVGMNVNPTQFELPKYYFADMIDPSGDVIHYIGDNDTFIVRLQAGVEIVDTLIPFSFLTFNESYQQTISYDQPINWPATMYEANPPMETIEYDVGPMMFLIHNETGTFIEAGYPDVEFYWQELAEGIGAWLVNFTIARNSTVSNAEFLSNYFVTNSTYTGSFNAGTKLQWSGYYTNNTDMDFDPLKTGAVIRPELGLCNVLGPNGERLNPHPDIQRRETFKLAYKAAFIEAFVYDELGGVANTAMQGDVLSLNFTIHQPSELVNGSRIIYDHDNLDWKIEELLANFTVQTSGTGFGENDTHYWNTATTYNFTIDFINDTISSWTANFKFTREKGTGTLVDIDVEVTNYWTIHDYEIEIGPESTHLWVNITFSENAPDMILTESHVAVTQIENVYYESGGTWYQEYPIGNPIDDWIDQIKTLDLSGDTIWSPGHFRLGDVSIWVPPAWTVTDNGAIDLDGNVYTTEDQYFIKRTGYWHDWGNTTVEGMSVIAGFDPSPGQNGDEFVSNSWMGAVSMIMEFEANESFYWYHASDFSPVNETELSEIQELLWNNITQHIPAPEYLHVAWMSENRTLDLSEITGLEDNLWTNTWFAWGTQQWFSVATSATQKKVASFRAEYAGLLVFNDIDPVGPEEPNEAPDFDFNEGLIETDEVTHVVLIDDIESIELRQPFGATNGTGDVIVDPDTEVEFGISIYNVSVSMYPLQIENGEGIRGPWHFRQSYEGVLGLNSTNFDYWITHATIDEMAFDITFSVDQTQYDPDDDTTWNHAVSFKIDQYFGEWNLTEFDNSVLNDRGLAVNFFATLGTGTRTQYQAGSTPVTDTNDDSVSADYYQFGSENNPFANVSMGGLPYTYGGDGHSTTYYSGSSTVPVGAFSAMYESSSGDTITNWKVDATMLFMTAGYTHWGGEEIICDPVFVSYSSSQYSGSSTSTTSTTTSTTTTGTGNPVNGNLYILVGGAVLALVIIMVISRRRR
ncbi:MAG: hypothetical protein GF411_12660 [Candidatus Lokiarchaeota archaeon]|nr:hypothetical protein [Candidatus Lokiarchaeota archaeon]